MKLYATTYNGNVRLLNDKWPVLFTTAELAAAEAHKVKSVKVITVHSESFDLGHCAIDHCWPVEVSHV